MRDNEWERLGKVAGRLKQPIHAELSATRDSRTAVLESFARRLAEELPQLQLVVTPSEAAERPRLTLGNRWHFHSVPEGTELEPFLQILLALGGEEPRVDAVQKSRIEALPGGEEVHACIGTHCPHCPAVLRELIPLVHFSRGCHLTVIDCTLFPETARELKIQAVPTLILAGRYRLTGPVRLPQILELLEEADPLMLSVDACRRMLKEGQAGVLTTMIMNRGEVFPGFVPLVTDREWSVRLGALVVMEELAEWNVDKVRRVLEDLWEAFDRQDVSTQGDLVYLIGALGDARWIPRLKRLLEAENDEEIREVVEEALENLMKSAGHYDSTP